MIDLNSRTALPDRINWFIDQAQENADRERRSYLGASILGGACERQIQAKAMGIEPDPGKSFPARVLRCFDRGHWAESYIVGLMRKAGFMLLDVDPATGKQFDFSMLDGRVAGHCDGIIPMWRGQGESPIAFPALWECKCLNSKGAKKAAKEKIRSSHPAYYHQVQIYMGEIGLPRCLFTVANADTMELYHEVIDYDHASHVAMTARARRIIQAIDFGEILPRGFDDPSGAGCKYCEFSDRCW